MEILYFEKLDSTHKFLLRKLKKKELFPPVLVTADIQTDGIGTRGRIWQSLKGNLFLSMAVEKKSLPDDLPLQSVSIYFAYLLKEILQKKGSKVWIKWPNDFYLDDKKTGGVLSQFSGENVIVSIGLNLDKSPENFQNIEVNISKNELIEEFVLKVKQVISWKYIFSKYQVEFDKSMNHKTTVEDTEKVSLKGAVLQSDGSILINGKRVYCNEE